MPEDEGVLFEEGDELLRYSVSLVTQNKHRFYTLTMPSEVLATTSFVTSRDEDPKEGFQRILNRQRAQEIADYVDTGLGTIPTSIILSAQAEADLRVIGRGKTLQFKKNPKSFLILDGQHRVYGFSLAKTSMRVPVVIYNNLNRRDETRLFIDINTKQRPVPTELLLDIRKLAEYQDDAETRLGDIFDLFAERGNSPLLGLMTQHKKKEGRITRTTFNAAYKPLLTTFSEFDPVQIYDITAAYLKAIMASEKENNLSFDITNPILFRAFMVLFPEVAQRVVDRFDRSYSVENFHFVLKPMFSKLKAAHFKNVGNSYVVFVKTLQEAQRSQIRL